MAKPRLVKTSSQQAKESRKKAENRTAVVVLIGGVTVLALIIAFAVWQLMESTARTSANANNSNNANKNDNASNAARSETDNRPADDRADQDYEPVDDPNADPDGG